MKKLISRLSTLLLLSTLASATASAEIKILAVGDSITEGIGGATSYRKPLVDKLDLLGCDFSMVGSRPSNRTGSFISPNEGYSANPVEHFLNATGNNPGINNMMDTEDPDVVLVHLGSNDMRLDSPIYGSYANGGTITELKRFVSRIQAKNSSAEIFVANVIPWFGTSNPNIGNRVTVLSGAINDWINNSDDSRLHLVDVSTNYQQAYMQSDWIHPNVQGDNFIAQAFYDAILSESVCIDTVAPTTIINDPASTGLTIDGNHTFKGIAMDAGGSGVDRVEILIRRTSTGGGFYDFNGGFSSTSVRVPVTLNSNGAWNHPVNLPNGNYRLQALVFDNAGNLGGWFKRDFNVINDNQPPTSTITTPASAGSNLTDGTVSGIASDTGGSGVDRVEILIRRTSTGGGFYDFNGGFSSTSVRVPVTLNSNGTWNHPVNLPNGNYRLQVLVFDHTGNISRWIRRDFTATPNDSHAPNDTSSESGDAVYLHYDFAPDPDDIHAVVAGKQLAVKAGLVPKVVVGTHGYSTGDSYLRVKATTIADEVYGIGNYKEVGNNHTAHYDLVASEWDAIIAKGGKVYVAEGGPSDFTYGVLNAMSQDKKQVIVVQHSEWNEKNTFAPHLEYVKHYTTYVNIEDGNLNNSTADLKQTFTETLADSLIQSNPDWTLAFNLFKNNIDFSDTVELLYILDISLAEVANVSHFVSFTSDPSVIEFEYVDTIEGTMVSPELQDINVELPASVDTINTLPQTDQLDYCEVVDTTLVATKKLYAAQCTVPRKDCDPVPGGWMCSSRSL